MRIFAYNEVLSMLAKAAADLLKFRIPVVFYCIIITVVFGKEGFMKLVLKIYHKMHEAKSMDTFWLNLDYSKAALPNYLKMNQNCF